MGSQEITGCGSETADRLAAAPPACLGLEQRRSFNEGLSNCAELFFQNIR
jgi:hypothetical protein